MRQIFIIVSFFLLTLSSCKTAERHKSDNLRKLSDKEILEHAKARNYVTDKTIFTDSLGTIKSRESVQKESSDEVFGDFYVNVKDEIVKVVLRKATREDKILVEKLKAAFEESEPISLVSVNCSEIATIMDQVYETDQSNRSEGTVKDNAIDKKNQQLVISIIENCGFPTAEVHGSKSVDAAFLVIQHAGKNVREKYFPLIKRSADKGDLQWSKVALMEDRMLMDRGEKQKYGSQVTKANGSDKWVLYPLQDPENVNKIREEVGLGPIEEYLEHFGIDYRRDK
ncbi:hypothetical protein QNI19_25120 [Cytophagaceae bacterium DM2B3-1]|uniref:Lipoprotein n=1 Tax=Xanthocytophaga flava TaxID=3048013 RepID=A0ABT7CR71_9BACT|nr:DUF6624 domain-containing protein [Xanthocytophaga flavus]MDJ1466900.1 hypothetical protein [Xanthocytophaga flavus]MDJ1496244.1 hypothetical protein [Xanthocytophaga flavus]